MIEKRRQGTDLEYHEFIFADNFDASCGEELSDYLVAAAVQGGKVTRRADIGRG